MKLERLGIFRHQLIACSCLLLGLQAETVVAEDLELSGSLTLGSDFLFRGVSQTMGGAAVVASVDVVSESGFYGYVWASNVDYTPSYEPDDGADIEVDYGFGYAFDVTDRLMADIWFVRCTFPGTLADIDYDYNELIGQLWLDEQYVTTIGYSEDVFGSGEKGLFYSIAAEYEVAAESSVSLEYGYYELEDAYDANYSYAGISISRSIGELVASLAYQKTFGDAEELFYAEAAGSRIVLSIDFDWSG